MEVFCYSFVFGYAEGAYAFDPGQMVADFVTGVVIGEILDGIMAAIQNKLRSIFANYDAAMCEALESGTPASRPTWRQSELDAATDFPDYDAQKSFIKGKEVPYGTKQSIMIDVRGQSVSGEVLSELYDEITQRTNNGIEILFKKD